MSKELDALVEVLTERTDSGGPDPTLEAPSIITALATRGYIITLDPTPLDGSDTKGANLALQRLRELGYKVTFDGAPASA